MYVYVVLIGHPKVRENWKMVLAAFFLLLIGLGKLICLIANTFFHR